MNNIIVKISDGELFNFFDSESRSGFLLGSRRSCDIVVKSLIVAPEQLRFVQKNNVWYVEDITPDGAKSEVFINGKRFRRPLVRFDGDITIRKAGEKKGGYEVKVSLVKKITRKRSGSNFDLTQKTVTVVGRSPSCDIVVASPQVGEKHFHIIYDGSHFYIEDLHSIGGTYVNNRKVRRAELRNYDRISVPSAAYTFFDGKLLFSTSPAGIQLDAVGVTKVVTDRGTRNKIRLVDSVSFRVEPGEFVAVVGGSGTGKSTLLDCLNGLRPATGGSIYYDTNNYYDNIKSYKSIMGYVPQRDIMHDDLTVEDGLTYTALLRMRSAMTREETRERVREAIADVKLTGKENLRISSLSGGQRKRVSIAMELLSDPKIIFLDEPTSGLSPDLDLELMELLKELAGKGRTIIVITHAMENLDKCDKVAFLGRGGRLVYYGAFSEAFRYFNRRSYSRIFAVLSDEEQSVAFERKLRSTEQYRKLHSLFCELYPDAKANMRPPETEKRKAQKGTDEAPAQLPQETAGEAAETTPEEAKTERRRKNGERKVRKGEEKPRKEDEKPRRRKRAARSDESTAPMQADETQHEPEALEREEAGTPARTPLSAGLADGFAPAAGDAEHADFPRDGASEHHFAEGETTPADEAAQVVPAKKRTTSRNGTRGGRGGYEVFDRIPDSDEDRRSPSRGGKAVEHSDSDDGGRA